MIRYFHDPNLNMLVAFDDERKSAYTLAEVSNGSVLSASSDVVSDAPLLPPTAVPAHDTPAPTKPARAKGKGCKHCGSTTRHRIGCPNAGMPKTAFAPERPNATSSRNANKMTQMTFGRVKMAQNHEVPLDEVSRNFDLTTNEVDKAFDAETYDDYLKA